MNDAMKTTMYREAAEAPDCVANQLERNAATLASLAERLRSHQPAAVVTIARGSSAHAATYARYLVETRLGILSSPLSPSIFSVFKAPLSLKNMLCLTISQSGRSPDLLAAASAARDSGAIVVALVNDPDSPLAEIASVVVPQGAGSEKSAAATKSFIASLSAIAQMVALWSGDEAIQAAMPQLPSALAQAWREDWSECRDLLETADHLYTVGRGLHLSVAQEAAHKLKETCMIHAEAYSSAEVLHGPNELAGEGFPVLLFRSEDEGDASVREAARKLAAQGASVMMAGGGEPGTLPVPKAPHPALAPLLQVQAFYRLANALACQRGHNPDQPRHVQKVTHTL
ncbi:MAG TPA: SIS domain-containing protein [Sphingomicrobium sp.]|nr:SIS domain-containing protein [Sphingomicrobium sp.]